MRLYIPIPQLSPSIWYQTQKPVYYISYQQITKFVFFLPFIVFILHFLSNKFIRGKVHKSWSSRPFWSYFAWFTSFGRGPHAYGYSYSRYSILASSVHQLMQLQSKVLDNLYIIVVFWT